MARTGPASKDAAPFTPTVHDPGPESAGERASEAGAPGPAPIRAPNGTLIRFGTASWTDPTLVRAGVFYPRDATSAEARLKYYATQFSMVEVDAPYYALPTRQTVEAWADRTPETFRFDIKAHALMTLRETDKLRAVLMQYPRWFLPGHASRDQILAAHYRFGDVPFTVELRNALWFSARNAEHTLQFLEDHG